MFHKKIITTPNTYNPLNIPTNALNKIILQLLKIVKEYISNASPRIMGFGTSEESMEKASLLLSTLEQLDKNPSSSFTYKEFIDLIKSYSPENKLGKFNTVIENLDTILKNQIKNVVVDSYTAPRVTEYYKKKMLMLTNEYWLLESERAVFRFYDKNLDSKEVATKKQLIDKFDEDARRTLKALYGYCNERKATVDEKTQKEWKKLLKENISTYKEMTSKYYDIFSKAEDEEKTDLTNKIKEIRTSIDDKQGANEILKGEIGLLLSEEINGLSYKDLIYPEPTKSLILKLHFQNLVKDQKNINFIEILKPR